MAEKFILERKTTYKQTDKYPKIHVGQDTYAVLAEMAAETGLAMSEITRRAVAYAAKNLVYCDISSLQEYALPVTQIETYDCRLASLAIGNKALTPAFDKNIYSYTCTTTDATNTITTVAKDGEATMVIKNGTTTVNNGAAATWAAGANTVTVKVANGDVEKTYTVTVTKS